MITEQEKLDLLLDHTNSEVLGITPGENFNECTPEKSAKEIRKALLQVRKGLATPVDLSF